jgi:hypothetical protein
MPLPRMFPAMTLMAAALVNESPRTTGRRRNTDAIADIWFFESGRHPAVQLDA